MKLGTTVGPHRWLVDGDTRAFAFVEPALNPRDGPVGKIDGEAFGDRLDEAGLESTVHLPHFPQLASGVAELDRAMRAYQRRAIETAATFDATVGVVHGATIRHSDRLREAFTEQVQWVAECCEQHELILAVENVGHTNRGYPFETLVEIVQETSATICFDVGHAYREGGQSLVETGLDEHGELISHLHIHDARKRGDDHIPIGTGEIDFQPVMEWATGRDVTVAIELLTDDFEHQRNGIRTLRELAR